jgi:hypothetical protein
MEPGRNQYSFFSSRATDAFRYARAACLRDVGPNAANSLTCEPVVLKVKFNSRTWCQVDFIREGNSETEASHLTFAVLGPVSAQHIIDVLHCMHGRRLGSSSESIRTFEDGTLIAGIRSLRVKITRKRPDAWMLKRLHGIHQSVTVTLSGGEMPEITLADNLRRLRQVRAS